MADAQFDLVESYDTAPQSDWFHTCRDAGKPYVVVRTSEKTADVMWDYVTLPPSYDALLMKSERFLKAQAISIFQKHASAASSVRVKATIVFFDNLTIPKAKVAANELYELIESLVEDPAQSSDKSPSQSKSMAALAATRTRETQSPAPVSEHQAGVANRFELSTNG